MKDCCTPGNKSAGRIKRAINRVVAVVILLLLAGGAVLALLKVLPG